MSLWADWLAVAGLLLVTAGTGAQAWGNLIEFRSLRDAIRDAAADETRAVMERPQAVDPYIASAFGFGGPISKAQKEAARASHRFLSNPLVLSTVVLVTVALIPLSPLFWYRSGLARIRAQGGESAVQLARFIRQAAVWGILMLGSVLVLAASVITLIGH